MAQPDPLAILKIRPPLWFFLLLALASAFHYLLPATRLFLFSSSILSCTLFLVGLIFGLTGSRVFAKEGTEIDPLSPANRVLVTHGPFRFSRNPMYVGMVLGLLGIAFYVGTLPFFLATLAQFCILNFGFIPFEEEKIKRQFGDEYRLYRQRVRRWL